MLTRTLLLLVATVAVLHCCAALNEELIDRLAAGESATNSSIKAIHDEWQIDKYPNFLKSCFMHKMSWELMKLKFQRRILTALRVQQGQEKPKFVISFTGSSVTAGHDSHFNASTPIVAGDYMRSAFSALGIDLDSRNVALGNNPCTPYDVCVKFFAGLDADIVHWEQTYFCEGRHVIEQFVRQALLIPSQPVVVFSESQTGKWETKDCEKHQTHQVTKAEQDLLKMGAVHLVSEGNKDQLQKRWSWLAEYTHHYHSAGIQAFQHMDHEVYACEGPYIPTWMEGAASWHPSVIGHKMRGAHHAYFWLLNLAEAIADLKALLSHRVLDAVEKDVEHRLTKLRGPLPPPRHPSQFPDGANCLTDYEPRPVREASLKGKVISGLASEGKPGWTHMIYEDIVDHNLVLRSLKMEYKDFKFLIHGNKDSGALNIALDLTTHSPLFLCETPGIWGSLPKGYDHLWSGILDLYITHNVTADSRVSFQFKKEAATRLSFQYDKTHEICSMVQPPGSAGAALLHPPGRHVLTVLGTSNTRAIIAWVVTA